MNPEGFRYPSAPIAEAVLGLVVEELDSEALARLGAFGDSAYPGREETVLVQAQIEQSPLGLATKGTRQLNGYKYTSSDGLHIVQMRTDGFGFSRLAPYETWDSFYTEARRLWQAYVALGDPRAVTRLSVRYINVIKVPASMFDIETYLRTRIEISDDMPAQTTGFFMSMDVPIVEHQCTARIVETVLPDEGPTDETRLVLDIDVQRDVGFYLAGENTQDVIDAVFVELRRAKNLVFEASITDESRKLFQ